MPKKPIDYSKTVFYKIACNDLSVKDCYIGHTTDFTGRKNNHKSRCKNSEGKFYNMHVYQFIRNHHGWENWSMLQIEVKEMSTKHEAEAHERTLIEQFKGTLNYNIPTQTRKEYSRKYRDKLDEDIKVERKQRKADYDKQYRVKRKVLERIPIECPLCGRTVRQGGLREHQKTTICKELQQASRND